MALSISQMLAVSYPAVVNEKGKAANQWEESALLSEMESQGGIKRVDLGPTIEMTLDYRANPAAGFFTNDLETVGTTKTEVITAASYLPTNLGAPMTWSKMDEATNPSVNQKVDLVASLITNGRASHDDAIERAFFTTSTSGFIGLLTHITDAGTGSDGGIDSSVETWWRNQQATYVDDTDIEAAFTTVWNACAKGSGSRLSPSIMVSDGATQSLFEGTLQAQQRWEGQDARAGFKTIMFKTARYVFSQYGTARVFFLNPKNIQVVVSKMYFRDREETQPLPNQNGFISKIYSALQMGTDNRSRLGVAHV